MTRTLTAPVSTVRQHPKRLDSLDALTSERHLASLFGPIDSLAREPLGGIGKSAAHLERVRLRLASGERRDVILKRSVVAGDWVAARSGDRLGREAAFLAEPLLTGVWQYIDSPYVAFAVEAGAYALLMEDVGPHLLAPRDAPLSPAQEDALLGAFAGLHARYWNAPVLTLPWLAGPAHRFSIFHPVAGHALGPLPPEFADWVPRGWSIVFDHLSEPARRLLQRAPQELAAACTDVPSTLCHGDARLVNIALRPGGRLVAFDWALASACPPSLDLGWLLVGNPGRFAGPKLALLARYRTLLEAALGYPLPASMWDRLLAQAVLFGAASLLWDRALDVEDGLPGAAEELHWWINALEEMWI